MQLLSKSARVSLARLMNKIKQYTEAAELIEELKEKNLALYEANMLLEEKSAGL